MSIEDDIAALAPKLTAVVLNPADGGWQAIVAFRGEPDWNVARSASPVACLADALAGRGEKFDPLRVAPAKKPSLLDKAEAAPVPGGIFD